MTLRRLAGRSMLGTTLGALLSSALALGVPDPPPDPGILGYPALELTRSDSRGLLLVSDSPETPTRSGVLYRDTVPGSGTLPGSEPVPGGQAGRVRVLAYHANGLGRVARLLLLARNVGDRPAPLSVLRQGRAVTWGPDPVIGQQTLLRYFASGPRPARVLNPGEQVRVYDSGPLEGGNVANLLIELESSAPLQLSVVMIAQGERQGEELPVLPADAFHQRGTFIGADRTLEATLVADTKTPMRLTLSGPDDPPLKGQDALTGSPQMLKGNFGVLYTLNIAGAAGRLLAASPRGGAYRGSVLVQDGAGSSQVLLGRGRALKDPAAPAALWQIRSPDFRLQIIPASGSSLPLALVFYPGRVNRSSRP